MTMMHHVQCVTSSHVVQKWWCPQGMIVRLVGPKSIMVTWWQNIMTIQVFATLSVLTGKPSMCLAPKLIMMAHCCILCKEAAARYHASHTLKGESWHAPFVPNKQYKFLSIPEDEQKTLNSRKGQRTIQKSRNLEGSDQQMQRLEETELRKAGRTVGVVRFEGAVRFVNLEKFTSAQLYQI